MASPPTSDRIGFLDPAGNAIDAPVEWTPAHIRLRIPQAEWHHARLTVQGQPVPLSLRVLGGTPRVVADWPRSGPGRYAIALGAPWNETVTIVIQPAKIGASAYATLLDDLERRLPAAIALGLQKLGGMAGLTLLPPEETTEIEEYQRLKRAVQGTPAHAGLEPVLHRLAEDPHHILRMEERWVRRERVRRPSTTRLVQALTRSGNLTEAGDPVRMVDLVSRHTVDIYENRLTLLYWQLVDRRLRRLERIASAPLRPEATALRLVLDRARRAARFLDEVTLPRHVPQHVSMVLLKRAEYRSVLEGYLELQRRLAVRLESPLLESPLENLPALYQLWGTLIVLDALVAMADELGYRAGPQRLFRHGAGEVFIEVVPDGRPVVTLVHEASGTRVELIPERSFGTTAPLRSISFTQRPDVVVTIQRPSQPVELVLFDPKYKLDGDLIEGETADGRPKKVDIDKMHAYRDAIRDADGQRVVSSAAILYPGPDVRYGDRIGAIRAIPGDDATLYDRTREILREALGPR